MKIFIKSILIILISISTINCKSKQDKANCRAYGSTIEQQNNDLATNQNIKIELIEVKKQ